MRALRGIVDQHHFLSLDATHINMGVPISEDGGWMLLFGHLIPSIRRVRFPSALFRKR
jgi:hypothetical protein